MSIFRTNISESVFKQKYKHEGAETWEQLSATLINDVIPPEYVARFPILKEIVDKAIKYHAAMKYIAAGRYLYYAGRAKRFFSNCYVGISQEDTREDWADLAHKAASVLMTGGGYGNDYSIYRPRNSPLGDTGGIASGAVSAMKIINEIGREVQQGGSRRSALYASLNWKHGDIDEFFEVKNWKNQVVPGTGGLTIADLKEADFNYPAPLDMTNISINYDNAFLEEVYGVDGATLRNMSKADGLRLISDLDIQHIPDTFLRNAELALSTGEPGFSFNFFNMEDETGRNPCCEVTSSDDGDVCNLASMNLAAFDSIDEFADAVRVATVFLLMGTLRAHLPMELTYKIREKNRRIGLGLMGVHEWLLRRGYRYEVVPELRDWLRVYQEVSDEAAQEFADMLGISRPVARRAVAPAGSIGMLAGTTTGIEPLFASAFKRRYLKGSEWHYEYVIDGTAKHMVQELGISPDEIETALDLAQDPERRIKFQADVQDFVDMGISSTINLPEWGSLHNNGTKVEGFARTLLKYAPRLRGFTAYPDGARGGQPLTVVPYAEAMAMEGEVFKEEFTDVCELTGSGSCGI